MHRTGNAGNFDLQNLTIRKQLFYHFICCATLVAETLGEIALGKAIGLMEALAISD
jgi:hypothetical protein